MLGRVRHYLDQHLFPDAPTPPRLTWRRLAIATGAAGALMVIQLARMWPSHPLDSLWAEDGFQWLPDAMTHGVVDTLTTPYSGYLQTSSRLVAEPVALLPVDWYPEAMALAGAAIVTGCVLVVWRASSGHIQTPYLRAALAAMVALVPVVGVEMLDNVTNAIWYLLFAAFWLLLWRPVSVVGTVGAAGLLFLAALSNGGIVLLFPLWLLRVIAIRDRRDALMVGAFAVGVALQVGPLLNRPENVFAQPTWEWGLLPAYAQRVIGGAVTGNTITGDLWREIGTPVEVVLATGLLACIGIAMLRLQAPGRLLVPLACVVSLGMFLVSGYERNVASALLWPEGLSNNAASRYVVVPTLLLSSALFVALDSAARHRVRAGVAALVLVAALFSFNASDESNRGSPTWSASLKSARSTCAARQVRVTRVPVGGPPFFGFTMPLPCSKLD